MAICNNHVNHEHITSNQSQIAVIVVPFPAQGHLNQLLQLSCKLASYGLPIHFLGSAIHNQQAKLRANGFNSTDISRIHFQDLPTPNFDSPPPNPKSTKKFPGHLQPSWNATLHLWEPVAAILHSISSTTRRVIVIHDLLMSMVVRDVALISNAESYTFNCLSVFNQFLMVWEGNGKPFAIEALPKDLPSVDECTTEEFTSFIFTQLEHIKISSGVLFNSNKFVEETFIDLMEREEVKENRKLWAIGPLLPLQPLRSNSLDLQEKCLTWLHKQIPKSVIYVSFGTSTSMSDEEIEELAMGLEQSGQKFIWVLRDADKGDIFTGEDRRFKMPEGFEDRVKERGIVVRDWAPQPDILAHPATGGFMSHCGWNSCIESISFGVPIAAWPMHSDQPWNALFIAEMLKVGLIVREWGRREEVVKSSTIADVVKRLLASEEGKEIRKRSEELGAAVRKSTEEGGVSRQELESFIAHITR